MDPRRSIEEDDDGEAPVRTSAHLPSAREASAAPFAPEPAAPAPAPAAPAPTTSNRVRAVATAVALVLGATLLVPAIVATWARSLVTDTESYLAVVAPLAQNPDVQTAIVDRATGAISDAVDLDARVGGVIDSFADSGAPSLLVSGLQMLRAPLVSAARTAVRDAATTVVASDAFASTWREANRVAHTQLVKVLEGDPSAVASLGEDGTLALELGSLASTVRDRLVDQGFTILAVLPDTSISYPLLVSEDLLTLQRGYHLLNVLGASLLWVAFGLLALGMVLTNNRARAALTVGAIVLGAGLLLELALTFGHSAYLNALAGVLANADAASAVYGYVVAGLRTAAHTTVALGTVITVVAALTMLISSGKIRLPLTNRR